MDAGSERTPRAARRKRDPKSGTTTARHAKEAVREMGAHRGLALSLEWCDQLSENLRYRESPPEPRPVCSSMGT